LENILVVSSSDKGINFLSSLLKNNSDASIVSAKSGGEARRLLNENEFDLVIVNTPLTDEFGHELSCMVTDSSNAGVIAIVKNEIADDVAEKVEESGVFVVPKPLSAPFFYQALRLVSASRRRVLGLKNENIKLQTKIEEIRLIDRAKCVLIEYLKMTEPQAHRYIEKQAMDMRKSRKDIAEGILNTYES
jgi:response regulator NasT